MRRMTAQERLRAAYRREEPDRVPAYPMSCRNNASLIGMSGIEYSLDGKKMAQSYLEYYKRFRPEYKPDVLILFQDTFIEAEAMGCQIELQEEDEPLWRAPAIRNLGEIKNLKIPDPQQDGRMPVMLEAVSTVYQELGKEVAIGTVCLGPFSICGALRGEEQFLVDLIENPKAVHEMMDIATNALFEYGRALNKAGGSASPSEPLPTVISSKHYDEFVFPYLKKLVERWGKEGIHTFLHVCGQSAHILEGLADTGTWAISVDENIDIGEAKRRVGDKVVLTGNVNPTGTMRRGTPEEVEEATKECIRKAAPGSGYILSSGCECPIGTPFENMEAMMIAAEKYGKYPIQI